MHIWEREYPVALKRMYCNKIGIWKGAFFGWYLDQGDLKACNSSMAAVTFDKEQLQSCFKAEIEVQQHYRDLTKSSNRAGLLPFPLIAAAWAPSHTYTTTTEDPTLTPGEVQHLHHDTPSSAPSRRALHLHQRQMGHFAITIFCLLL